MEFKVRASGTFIMNMLLVVLAVLMAVYSRLYTNPPTLILHYAYIVWLLIAIFRFFAYRKYISLMINGNPALIVTEQYIYDGANDIRYHWADIEEIKEASAYLYISVDNRNEYIKSIKNPLKRFTTQLLGSALCINIDMVKVNPDALLEILDNYSDKADGL